MSSEGVLALYCLKLKACTFKDELNVSFFSAVGNGERGWEGQYDEGWTALTEALCFAISKADEGYRKIIRITLNISEKGTCGTLQFSIKFVTFSFPEFRVILEI